MSSDKNLKLVIAGHGKIKKVHNARISYVNKWLSNEEILVFVSNAKVVVFPYIEASQSGLLPLVMSFNKTIVISNQPGLIEQSKNYVPLKVFQSENSEELKGILEEIVSSCNQGASTTNINNHLTEHDFASKLHHFTMN